MYIPQYTIVWFLLITTVAALATVVTAYRSNSTQRRTKMAMAFGFPYALTAIIALFDYAFAELPMEIFDVTDPATCRTWFNAVAVAAGYATVLGLRQLVKHTLR